MMKWVLLIVVLGVAWYMWKNDVIESKFMEKSVAAQTDEEDEDWCEVKRTNCKDLARMLNAFSPGRYFDGAGKLLDTSLETMTMVRENNGVTFFISDGTKVIHTQNGRGKGNVTVIFSDGYTMKYDKKGNLLSAN